MNQVAKRLMRLTLGALLLTRGEALGQSSSTCLVSTTGDSSTWTVSMLAVVNFVLMIAVLVLIKIACNMHKRSYNGLDQP